MTLFEMITEFVGIEAPSLMEIIFGVAQFLVEFSSSS